MSLCGTSRSDCSIVVRTPINEDIVNGGIEISERVEITCWCSIQSVGDGRWYFNGSEIDLSDDSIPYQVFDTDYFNSGHILIIPNFLPQYVGNYTCTSSNGRVESLVIELKISQRCK